ncbi:MAG: hypothetical protein IJD43_13850 [Thermoguttaceae bacterium]|nr:hypothetical protein [Thermoguttaceae bacterium]
MKKRKYLPSRRLDAVPDAFRMFFTSIFTLLPAFTALVLCVSDTAGGELKILAPPTHQNTAYQIAAEELQKYWELITDERLEIVHESNAEDEFLIIGSDSVNRFVRDLIERKVIRDLPLKTASDDFRLLSVQDGERRHLIFAGGRGRSTLYAVYAFLEERAGCRWFWDGDIVPKHETLDISGLDIHESPRFEYRGQRYFAHRSLHRFQAEHWSLEDWQKEIDWLLKKRLNVFMLRIGMDDVFQKAFPDIVDYPDPAKPLPEALGGYDNRSLFWSLEFRGKLRKGILDYAFERDLMHPEDFGTVSHWYSRTPKQFLEKVDPKFLPQEGGCHGEPTGLAWDIREDQNLENYWKLTEAHLKHYGKPGLFHTIGLAERYCYRDREDNLRMKLYTYRRLIENLRENYPDGMLLLATWDFYFGWKPEEVREFVSQLDPEKTLIWDYAADSPRANNFTNWGVVGKFPYVFGIFQAYENAMDIRGNYPLIEERQKVILNDPFCRGYILWPENSHADIFMLHYFTKNAWKPGVKSIDEHLADFCAERYGDQAEAMNEVWKKVLPISQMLNWSLNFWSQTAKMMNAPDRVTNAATWQKAYLDQHDKLTDAPEIFRLLAEIDWSDPFIRRDTIDLARTTADRLLTLSRITLIHSMHEWSQGRLSTETVRARIAAYWDLACAMRDFLALHEDYSMWESLEKLKAVEPILNPDFDRVLLDNASCSYCQSHQYELMEYWYLPSIRTMLDWGEDRLAREDRSKITPPTQFPKVLKETREKVLGTKLIEMRPVLPRTPENYRKAMLKAADAAERIL